MLRALLLTLSLLALSGCATISEWWAGEDNAEPPAELTDFTASVTLKTLWSTSVGEGVEEQNLKLVPQVAGGRVFTAGSEGRVSAFDAENGARLWSVDLDLPLSGGPGVGEGLVLVGSSDGQLVALRANNGEEAWRAQLTSEVLSVPRAADGVVVVRTVDGRLFGLAADNGERRWVYQRTVPVLTLRGTGSPLIVSGHAVAGFDNGYVAVINLSNGRALWEKRIAVARGRTELERMIDIDADPLRVGGDLYVASYQGKVVSLDLRSGQPQWSRDVSVYTGLASDGENVYVTDEFSEVWALERGNGAAFWKQASLRARKLTAPVVYGDHVVVGDFEGYLHLLSTRDGHFTGRVRHDGSGILAAPVVAGDTLYVLGRSGRLSAMRLEPAFPARAAGG
jgi:outer membrane protein assembly factor BamB